MLVIVTVTPGRAEFDGSVMVPWKLPVVLCAKAVVGMESTAARTTKTRTHTAFMEASPEIRASINEQ